MRTIALFCSLPGEPPTAELLRRWKGVWRLVLPVVEGNDMYFREYTSEEDLASGAFGIREPQGGRTVPPEQIDIMLVPGTAFDREGNRKGRGRGYYDRYLGRPEAVHIYKIGFCTPEALVEHVPTKPHDVKMDKVICTQTT